MSFGVKRFNSAKGSFGEGVACDFLRGHGFEIVECNYLCKHGEIDIIASRGGVWHFIEVKMRASDKLGHGRDAVDLAKRRHIRAAAQMYLMKRGLLNHVYCCFDVVEIEGSGDKAEIQFLENCF